MIQLRHCTALHTETHKLIVNCNDEPELYDLVHAPHEIHNIASAHPFCVAALQRQWKARAVEGIWHK